MVADLQGEGRRAGAETGDRITRVEAHGAGLQVRRLLSVGRAGLAAGSEPSSGEFAQTLRRANGPGEGQSARREGTSVRYTAIAALGLARLDVAAQCDALHGRTAADLARAVGVRALEQSDPGAIALAAWAIAEVSGSVDGALFSRLDDILAFDGPIPTVDLSWILTAAVAAGRPGEGLAELASSRLLAGQGPHGIFPHVLPADSQNRWRRHVGSFADQVYPIQALARMFRISGDRELLEAAEATARRICDLQGSAGQWWWHYDMRTGEVVERFPVYSVHQHAMAPMALFDLSDAGGTDRTTEIVRGLQWIEAHPEVDRDLVSEPLGLIWRKVGRREPRKAVRRISAVTTAIRPGLHVPGVDRAFPANTVDYECRPYELGWLLYVWLPARRAARHG